VNVTSCNDGILAYYSNLNITNSSFYNNTDQGIEVLDSVVNIANCTFTSNPLGLEYDTISGGSAGIVTDSNFISNTGSGLISDVSLFISNCSFIGSPGGLGLLGKGSIVENCNFSANDEAITIYDSSTVINSTIFGSISYDLYLDGPNSHPTLLNTTFDISKVYYSTTAPDLTVKWYLHVYVQDSVAAPVPSADVRVWDNDNGTYTENKTTDASGYARWFAVTEYIQSDNNGDEDGADPGETVYYTPHSVRAMNETSHAYVNATVDTSKTVTVTLTSDSSPEPPSGLTAERQWMDIELNWTASPSPDASFYRIFRSIDPGVFNFGSPFATTALTNWTDVDGATNHYTYHYVVRTVDDGGNEEGNTVMVWNGDWVVNDTQAQNDLAAAINGSIVVTGNGSLTLSRNNMTCWDVTVQNGGELNIDNSTGEFFGNLDVSGDLLIENCANSTLTGNTYVRGGGAFDLINSTVIINCSSDGQWGIWVLNGGILNVTEDSMITAKNINLEYNFWYKSGSFGSIRNSTVSEAGYSNIGGSTGIMIESDDVIVDNATIMNNNRGLYIKSASPLIKNTNISYSSTEGIQIQSGAPAISDVEIYSAGTGIWNDWGAPQLNRINMSWCGWGLRMFGSSIIINDLHVANSFQNGIRLLDNSDSTFYNSSIHNSGSLDVGLGTGSDPVFVNTTFNASKISTGNPSSLTVKWFVHVRVNNSLGNPVFGANVRYQDNANGTYDQNFTTDADGFVRWVPVTQVVYISPNEEPINYTPYLIVANKTGMGANSTYLEFNRSTTVYLTLENNTDLTLNQTDIKASDITIALDENVTFNATVHNLGIAANGVVVRYYNGDPDMDDNYIIDVTANEIGVDIIDTPGWGSETNASFIWTPTSTGTFVIYIWVDADNTIGETDDTNNMANITITVIKTDLSVSKTNISIEPSNPIDSGYNITINATIFNNVNVNVTNVIVGFYYGDPDTDKNGVLDVTAQEIDRFTIGRINANDHANATTSWLPPALGIHELYIWVDPDNVTSETDEWNNIASIVLEIYSWADDFRNESRVFQKTNVTRVGEDIILTPTETSGSLLSVPINLSVGTSWFKAYVNKTNLNATYNITVSILNATDNQPILGFENRTVNEIDLTGIDGNIYPTLRLVAFFTSNVTSSPILHHWGIDYGEGDPPIFAGLVSAQDRETNGEVVLNWDPASDPSTPITYRIYQSTTQGNYNFASANHTTQSTSFIVGGLTNGVDYWFVVRAQDSMGNEDLNTVEKNATPTGPDNIPPAFGGLVSADDKGHSGNVSLSWNAASDPDTPENKTDPHVPITYNIYISTIQGSYNFASPNHTTTDTNYVIQGLTDGVKYWFVVRAEDSVGNQEGNTVELNATPTGPDNTPPAFAGLVSANDEGDGGNVSLSWAAASDPDTPENKTDPHVPITYNIYISTIQGSYNFASPNHTTQGISYTVQGLTNGVKYWFVVRAADSLGNEEGNTIELNATPTGLGNTPPVFLGLTIAEDVGNGGNVTLSWADATDPNIPITYNIYISTTPGDFNFASPNYTTTSTSFTVFGLEYGVKYWFVVRAADSLGLEETNLQELNATPTGPDTTPPVFTGLVSVIDLGLGDAVNLSWSTAIDPDTPENKTDPHEPITYNIYFSTIQGVYDFSSPDYTTQELYYVVDGLTAGTEYWFIVRAADSTGNEEANINEKNETPTIEDLPPEAPTGLTILISNYGDAVILEWTPNSESDIAGYSIYRSEIPGEGYTLIDTTDQTTYTDTTITEGSTYYYVIDAYDNLLQNSSLSQEVEITVNMAPAIPTGLSAVFYPTKTLNITWNANSEADLVEYILYYSIDGVSFNQLTTIQAGTHYYKISARDEVPNESNQSQVIQGFVEIDGDGETPPTEFPWWILIIIAIVVVVLLFLILSKRGKGEEELPVSEEEEELAEREEVEEAGEEVEEAEEEGEEDADDGEENGDTYEEGEGKENTENR
jgi:protocatechuate 3,4-dioxygenase beta subunit